MLSDETVVVEEKKNQKKTTLRIDYITVSGAWAVIP